MYKLAGVVVDKTLVVGYAINYVDGESNKTLTYFVTKELAISLYENGYLDNAIIMKAGARWLLHIKKYKQKDLPRVSIGELKSRGVSLINHVNIDLGYNIYIYIYAKTKTKYS